MLLDENSICHYLLDKGYIDFKSVVDGDFTLSPSFSRNRNFIVKLGSDKKYFVKQIRAFDNEKKFSLRVEATCYWLANNDANYSAMSPFLPPYYDYDLNNHVLVLGLIENVESLYNYYSKKRFPNEIAKQTAIILASYHYALKEKINTSSSVQFFKKQLPWIFEIDIQSPHFFNIKNDADWEIINLVKNNKDYIYLIRELKKEWEFISLIHGDIKWANFLINTNEKAATLKLIDWEIADIGDPCWDVAGIFQSYLTYWIFSEFPLEVLQPSIKVFWDRYTESMHYGSTAEANNYLLKSIKFTGVRIIQTCLESTYNSTELSLKTVKVLQMGLNILKDPIEAKNILLGLN